jgi:hypothetical protein
MHWWKNQQWIKSMNSVERTIADSECKESKIIMKIMNKTEIATLQMNDEGYGALCGFK